MKYFILGGAGFIGSNLTSKLLNIKGTGEVVVFDNFSSGTLSRLDQVSHDKRLKVIAGEIKDFEHLNKSMSGADIVFHFAANPYISKAVDQPDIDFWEGTYLTQNVLEALRLNAIPKLIYSSGSGVYGEHPNITFTESYGPCMPISTYGASKLACEAMISAYCHMFSLVGYAFRFANVVGPYQTHGVGYDFLRKLQADSTKLDILGDGMQSKPYIHVDDVIRAMLLIALENLADLKKPYDVFNVAPVDFLSVNEIADSACNVLGLNSQKVKYIYSGSDRGWKGDVPIVRFDSTKIKNLGWEPLHSSLDAINLSLKSMKNELA